VGLHRQGGSTRIAIVPSHKPAPLEELLAFAQGYAEFAMRDLGHVPPALLGQSPTGLIRFVARGFKDGRAKDDFANAPRLVCGGYAATAAVMVLEPWMKVAQPGEKLDMSEPPSEAFDRCEVVVLTGETAKYVQQRLLPISRTDAGGFFGLAEHAGQEFDHFEGRFAQMLPSKPPNAEARKLARAMLAAMGVTLERLRGNAGWN